MRAVRVVRDDNEQGSGAWDQLGINHDMRISSDTESHTLIQLEFGFVPGTRYFKSRSSPP